MSVIVGGVVEKDGKYLLVQEAKAKCYGKWNLPAGHLEIGETVFKGAIREIKEETNCDVELTGICQIGNLIRPEETWISIVFTTNLLTADVRHQEDELLDARWFTYDDIVNMHTELRAPEWIISAIDAQRSEKIAPLSLINVITNKNIQ